MIQKGKEMDVLIFIFVACIVAMFAAVYVYNKKEDTAYHATLTKLKTVEADLKQVSEKFDSARNIAAQQGLKIAELESKILCAGDELKKFKVEIDTLQEHCARIREQQMDLKNQLSQKRPVIRLDQPIPVQVVPAQKADSKLVNKIKKQMKEVSQ